MTQFTDFIHEFPARCHDVLELFSGPAQAKDREVTLLVMTAAAAFVIAFERLRPGMAAEHPSADRRTYPQLAEQLDDALGQSFLGSPFLDDGPASWCAGKMDNAEAYMVGEPLTGQIRTGQVLATIRNALAHGNLHTLGGPLGATPETGSLTEGTARPQIEALRFFANDRRRGSGYIYVLVSPTDFHSFLVRWCLFLKARHIPPIVVGEALSNPVFQP
jgi:hypothetical protein